MRSYVVSVAGGTATTSIQIQANGTIKAIAISAVVAAAGSYEISLNPLSQIGTAAPASDVLARARFGATLGGKDVVIPTAFSVKAFQVIYVHSTGAGNVGEVTLFV